MSGCLISANGDFRTFLDRGAKGIKVSSYEVKNVENVVVGTDIQVRVFTLADGDVIPWHYHSESTDHYFVLRGQLTIETHNPDHLATGSPSAKDSRRLLKNAHLLFAM